MPLDFTNSDLQPLIASLNKRKAFVIAGAGVSSASIDSDSRKIFGTWTNLLRYGIAFCCDKCRQETTWGDTCRTFLDNEHATTEELLKIGDDIWDCLIAHGKVQEWLDIFDNALPEYRELILAIKELGVPIATANYDNLLEDITHLTPITLQDTQKVEDFIKNDQKQKYILHLHGYYKKPDSIVLGQKSYDRIVQDEFAQFINRYLITAYDTVIFVGFGQGVYDQNFSLIFKWASTYLRKTKLYHIVLNRYVDETKQTHQNNGNPNVVVLGYGDNYNDLTPFINAIAHTIEHDDDLPKTLEGKPICLGQNRLDLVEKVADYLSKNYHKPIGILGTGGLGKTNLVLNLLHHRVIARKYRRNRFFVRCDGAKDLALLQNTLINALEIPVSSGDLGDRLLNYLSHQDNRFLIALDNFETAWQDKAKVEPFIERLKDHADLVFTYRGNASPDELDWKVFKVPFLSEPDAITLFNENSGENFAGNPLVKTMVKEVDCLPLAVELLAKRAKKVEKLEDLYRQWHKTRNDFLSKGGDKNTNLNLSISFSYENTRLTDANRAFLQALGYLPQGMNRTDLETIFDDAYDQLEILKEFGLCEETDQARLWVLAPIREYLKPKITTDQPLIAQIQDFYLSLSKDKGEKVGYEENNAQILQAEWSNIIKVITDMLTTQKGIDTLSSLTLYCQFTGFYPTDLFKKAIEIADENQWEADKANCLSSLGDLAFRESDNDLAREYFQEALPLYEKIGDLLGKANCLRSLGDLAFRESDNDLAREYFQEALPLYEKIGALLGKANCLRSLGDLAFRESDNDLAREYFQEALPLYEKIGDLLGKANCLRSLGDLAFRESDNDLARAYFQEALPLYEKIGDLLGKANCLSSLGDLAFRESDNDLAREYFQEALPLYEKIGALLGKANCLSSLGDLAFRESDNDLARAYFQEALPLYEKIGALLGKANCLRSLGDLAFRESDNDLARAYFQEALPLYEKIGDLLGKANCLSSLGDLAFQESDNDLAREYFQEALPLYEKIGDLLGKANCLSSLGDLAFRESDNDLARAYFQEALPLYEKIGALLGKANCLRSLGDLAFRESDNDLARAYFQEALPLYEKIGALLGKANCLRSLGSLAFRESDNDLARAYFQEALPLYEKIGALLGKANCLRSLGSLAFRESDNDLARAYFQEALPLYEKIGALLGKANCLSSLGDLAFRESDNEKGNELYQNAILLYQKLNDHYSVGRAYYLWSFKEPDKKKGYQCMAKKVLLAAKQDVWVRNWGLTELECE